MKDELARTMRIRIPPERPADTPSEEKDAGRHERKANACRPTRPVHVDETGQVSFAELLHSVYDAVLITDESGAVVHCNDRALEFFLYDERDLLGANIVHIISGADNSLLSRLESNLRGHRYSVIEAYCVRSDNSQFAAEIAVGKLRVDNRERRSFFIRDISSRKKVQEELEHAIARLEEHDRAKSQFIANVSHELRTPMTSMIYAISNMLTGVTGPLSSEVTGYLEMLERECKRLLDTVNDILDLEKIEMGALTLATTRLPLVRIVAHALRPLRAQAQARNVTVSTNMGHGRWFVDCDANKIERVITNVIDNAIKFTPEDSRIDIYVRQDEADTRFVIVGVSDAGVGIPKDALPHVQERFFRVGDQISGSGLGLSIAKEILERHGGNLAVTSPAPGSDKGTLVTIRMPIAAPPLVLVVDDEPNVLTLLDKQIGGQGYRVAKAESGQAALQSVQKERPDLVLSDLVMDEMDGCDLIIRLKSRREWRDLPVVVLTGAGLSREKAAILASYAVPVISKPWKGDEILDHVEDALVGNAAFADKRHVLKGHVHGRQDKTNDSADR